MSDVAASQLEVLSPHVPSVLVPSVQPAEAPAAVVTIPLSGAYNWDGVAGPGPQLPFPATRESVSIDVDGWFPQNVASGTIATLTTRLHWISRLTPAGAQRWTGSVFFVRGGSFPFTSVDIKLVPGSLGVAQKATILFTGPGVQPRGRTYLHQSPSFRKVAFEFDSVVGVDPVLQIQTHDHPNRPANLPNETLSIETVFRRAGFDVSVDAGSKVPMTLAGINQQWSNSEMHDAMQAHWSRFADKPQWALWVFFAKLHEQGTSLGGIMFDSIGPNHRQGTAIFNDSFISQPQTNSPAAFIRRARFWTAVHEMGHSFNLAHSWQKALGTPWQHLQNAPEERSYMNYPYNVLGGVSAFYNTFHYRFSDPELLFMRHAPNEFVEMGNAKWFDNHAFEEARTQENSSLELSVRVNRATPKFEFMEPVVIELKLKNVSDEPILVDEHILNSHETVTLIVKKDGHDAHQFEPFATYCFQKKSRVLAPGESIYESVFVGAGSHGWQLAEPGNYQVSAALHLENEDVVAAPLALRVLPPKNGYDEEVLAQDYFSEDVARVLAFDGSRELTGASEILSEVAAKLPDSKAALHGRLAQACVIGEESKYIDWSDPEKAKVKTHKADEKTAAKEFTAALLKSPGESATTLGHIDYKYYVDRFATWRLKHDDTVGAAKALESLEKILTAKKVVKTVLDEIRLQLKKIGDKK